MTKVKTPAVTVVPADIERVADDVSTNVLIERRAEMRTIVLGSLAGANIHQLGPPGTGKSLGLRQFCSRITGGLFVDGEVREGRYFEKTVHAQMPADALIGGYDMPRFAQTGEFARNVEHYLPNANFAFIDEITRANGPTLDALLPTLNTEERLAEANGGMFVTPLMFVVTASNYMPDPDDPHLGALVDRFTLMQFVDYVRADDSFKDMLERHHARRIGEKDNSLTPETMTLEQFRLAQDQVNRVRPTPEWKTAYANLRRDARGEGLRVSDRRYMELGRVCRASAWLAGRDFLIAEDLAAVESGLWRDTDQIPLAHKLVLPFHGRFEREAADKTQEAAEPLARLEAVRPQVEGTPPNVDIDNELLREVLQVSRRIETVKDRVDGVLAEAAKEQRDASGLRDLSNELAAAQEWMRSQKLGI